MFTKRADQALVDRGLCVSREKAQRAILAGQVRINNQPVRKASDKVRDEDHLEVLASDRYVSRGGHKLEHALTQFELDPTGLTAIDLGASTGGFTDCLLQHGAKHVYAIDVGHGQLAWSLRQDPRVTVMEGVNARTLRTAQFPPDWSGADLAVIDCSFISLQKIIPAAQSLVRSGGRLVALIKPQFEAGKAEADRGAGVITDPAIHQRVVDELMVFVEGLGSLRWRSVIESPLRGPAGNTEFLVLLEKTN